MSDISLEWPADSTNQGDFGVSTDGDLLVADFEVETRQRVVRRWLTNNRQALPDGSILAPDDLFNPTYGSGMRRLIGQAVNANKVESLKQIARDGMMQEDTVSLNPPPDVYVQQPAPGALSVFGVFANAQSQRPTATPKITIS